MKILSLEASNILRLTAAAVTVDTDQSIVTVSGQNGQGKSSLLNAIAMAIGGKKLCPPEPLKRGKDKGHVTVDLGDYIVTRTFWRSTEHVGEIGSRLEVTSRDGAVFKSPQALLDKLVSDLTFDPLAFLELSPREQREHVRRLVGLDFTDLDQQRQASVAHATTAQQLLQMAERDVEQGEYYPDAPAEGVDVAQLLANMAQAEQLASAAADAEKAVEAKRRAFEATTRHLESLAAEVARLEEALDETRREVRQVEEERTQAMAEGKTLRAAADAARAAVPDTAALREQLAQASRINAEVQANQRHAAILQTRDEARDALRMAKSATAAIDAEKQARLSGATFPVEGLAFVDDGLTFQGLPFEQASYAQQLRVAVAMGLSMNPALKVLLIKHGNALDANSLRLLATLADEAGAQVWIERVAEAADGVSIFIEDGKVLATEAAA